VVVAFLSPGAKRAGDWSIKKDGLLLSAASEASVYFFFPITAAAFLKSAHGSLACWAILAGALLTVK
jgi:hypothetical protein